MTDHDKFRIVVRVPDEDNDPDERLYDENEDGDIVDARYAGEHPVTRYKLVCENDVDTGSLPEKDRHVVNDYIEKGLESVSRAQVVEEVRNLLEEYRLWAGDCAPEDDHEILLDRIDTLLGPSGRPLEVVVGEHLVGTTEEDPVIWQMNGRVSEDVRLGRIQMKKKSFFQSEDDPVDNIFNFKTHTLDLASKSTDSAIREVKELLKEHRRIEKEYEGDDVHGHLKNYWDRCGENLYFIITSIDQAGNGSTPKTHWQLYDFSDTQKISIFLETY